MRAARITMGGCSKRLGGGGGWCEGREEVQEQQEAQRAARMGEGGWRSGSGKAWKEARVQGWPGLWEQQSQSRTHWPMSAGQCVVG